MIGVYGSPGVIGQLIDFGYGHVGFLIATASEDWNLVLER